MFQDWGEGRWDGLWLEMVRGGVQATRGPGGEAPWLARGLPKAGLAGSIYIYISKKFQNLPGRVF